MPEGPEVWFLAQAVRAVVGSGPGVPTVTAHGKHLVIGRMHHHFGLSGRLRCVPSSPGALAAGPGHDFVHVHDGGGGGEGPAKVTGHVAVLGPDPAPEVAALAAVGVDWMTADAKALEAAVFANRTRRVKLGAWMLDQHCIAGVGVAWASEIAAEAGLDVTKPLNAQNLRHLGQAYITVRDRVTAVYAALVPPDPAAGVEAVNAWFGNLYAVRPVAVYGKGVPVKVASRMFWRPRE
jgi:formamidopyrimidine-DNA glycosylase